MKTKLLLLLTIISFSSCRTIIYDIKNTHWKDPIPFDKMEYVELHNKYLKEKQMELTDKNKELRCGKFSASSNSKLMGQKGLGKTGETYIFEVAAEILTGEKAVPEFTSAATSWGKDHELEAQLYFEAATSEKVSANQETIVQNLVSGTPDGVLKDKAIGFEIKCPYNSTNHLKNLSMKDQYDLLSLRPEYYWQIVTYAYLLNIRDWKFCSYDPRFKGEQRMLILNVKVTDDDIDLFLSRIAEAEVILNDILKPFK